MHNLRPTLRFQSPTPTLVATLMDQVKNMINGQTSKRFKLLGNCEFNHLI